jgi:hypothetical protein
MITHVFADIPCPCGRRHHLPLDPNGRVAFVCGSVRRLLKQTVNEQKFQKALAASTTEQFLATEEGICVVHKAAAPVHDQQRCEDCGWLLVSYAAYLSKHFTVAAARRDDLQFWPTGALVGLTNRFDLYLARHPMTPHRERRCFIQVA